ncbi:MAG: hypothetical protein IT557_01660 [Alphaproteobacteria bacterium]|nr:hypothetical protein [Alphaproteobacteria bacterium]
MSSACRAPFFAVLRRALCLALSLAGMLAAAVAFAPEAAAQGTPSYSRLTVGGHAGRGGVMVDESVLARLGPALRAPALMSQPTHRPRVSGLTLAPRLAPPPRWAMRNAPIRRGAVRVAQGDTDLAERPRPARRRVASSSRARQLAAARAQARRVPVSLQRPAGNTRAILAAAGDAGLSPARVRQRGRTIIIEPAVIAAVMRGPAPVAAGTAANAPSPAEMRAPMPAAPMPAASMIAPAVVASAARAPAAMAPAPAPAPTRSVAAPAAAPAAPAATARPVAPAVPASERLVPPPPALAAAPPPPPVIPAAPGIAPLGPTPLPGTTTTQLAQAQPPAVPGSPAPAPRPAAPPPAALLPQPAPQIVVPPATPPQSAPAPARQAAAPAVRPLNLPTLTPPISPPSISPPAPQAMAAAPAALPGAIPPSTATPAALTQGAAPTSLVFAPEGLVLTQAMREELQRLARRMPSNEAVRVQVLAYATAPGNDAARARRTSLSRATLVRSFLIEQGLRSTRIDVRALGQQGSDGPRDRVDLVVGGP